MANCVASSSRRLFVIWETEWQNIYVVLEVNTGVVVEGCLIAEDCLRKTTDQDERGSIEHQHFGAWGWWVSAAYFVLLIFWKNIILCSEGCFVEASVSTYTFWKYCICIYYQPSFRSVALLNAWHNCESSCITRIWPLHLAYTTYWNSQRESGNPAWYLPLFHVTFRIRYPSSWQKCTSLPILYYQTVQQQSLIHTMEIPLCKMLFRCHYQVMKLGNLLRLMPLLAVRVHYHHRRHRHSMTSNRLNLSWQRQCSGM